MKRIIIAASTAALAICGVAHADETAKAMVATAVGNNDAGPRTKAVTPAGVEITAGEHGGEVNINLSWVNGGDNGSVGVYTTKTLTFASPLNDSADQTELANLDGLANATTAEFKFSSVRMFGIQSFDKSKYDAICARAVAAYTAKTRQTDGADKDCIALVAKYDQEDRDAYNDLFWSPKAYALILGGGAKVGYDSFNYLDPANLTKQSTHKTPWSASLFVAYFPRSTETLLTLGYDHQEAYEAASIKTICPAGTPPVVCATGALAGPDQTKKDLISFDVRRRFGSIGLASTVVYDAKQDVWGVETPIYFIRGKTGGELTGGLKLGWRSDDHDLRVGVFVAKSFSVLNF